MSLRAGILVTFSNCRLLLFLRPPLAFPHPISHADLREDISRLSRIGLQLPADVGHIYPQDLVVVIVRVGAPDVVDDVVIGEDAAAVFGQQGDQLVLDLGEVDLLVLKEHQAAGEINGQILEGVDRLAFSHGAAQLLVMAQGGADAGQKLGGAEGLGDVIVAAAVQGQHLFLLVGPGGNDDNGHHGPFPHLLDDLDSVHIRQAQIQKDQVGKAGGDEGKAFLAGGCGEHLILVGSQRGFHEVAYAFFVFNNDNRWFKIHRFHPHSGEARR